MSKTAGDVYGAIKKKGEFSFVGFAKKAKSDDAQKIDIYLDQKLIQTVEANDYIQEFEDVYGVENLSFKYNLATKYIDGKSHSISFKHHNTNKELKNSPIKTIDKNDEDFNETRFLLSLNEPINEELKNMYKPNSIGFLATKENLEDEEFVGYIKELIKRFPEVEFKGFCFEEKIKERLKKDLNRNSIKIDTINDYHDILDCEIFIFTHKNGYLIKFFINNFSNIYPISYNKEMRLKLIKDFSEPNHILFTDASFKFEKKQEAGGNIQKLVYYELYKIANIEKFILDNDSFYEIHYFERVNLLLQSNLAKSRLIKITYKLINPSS